LGAEPKNGRKHHRFLDLVDTGFPIYILLVENQRKIIEAPQFE